MTKKKKSAILISALALIAVIVIGGTLVHFTHQDTVQNVFTLGKVEGNLTETTAEYETPMDQNSPEGATHQVKPGTPTEEGISYNGIIPGDWLSKEPRVSLTGKSEDAYVRVKLEVINEDGKLNSLQKRELLTTKCLNFGENWVFGVDGYIYYQEKLTRDPDGSKQTDPVFTIVKIPEDWDNSTVGETSFKIAIQADLIQAENFESSLVRNNLNQIISWGKY